MRGYNRGIWPCQGDQGKLPKESDKELPWCSEVERAFQAWGLAGAKLIEKNEGQCDFAQGTQCEMKLEQPL